MNAEIKRLQYEIKKLRKQNLERQKQIRYIPLNIISNNLYINNSLNNAIPVKNKANKNSRYNSFIKKRNYLSNSSSTLYKNNKKNKSYGKFPFKQGMFSYKNSLMNSAPNNNYKNFNNIPSNRISNKYNNNNSLLSTNLKLNIDNDDNDNNISQNNIIHGRFSSTSSLDLNKYKITEKIMNKNKAKNISYGNLSHRSYKNYNNNGNLLNNSNVFNNNNGKKNSNNSNFSINNNINNNIQSNNNINNNKINQNSFETTKISPIIPKVMSNKENNSPSLLLIDDYKDNNNNNNFSSKNINKKRKFCDHFKERPDNEKESRRMIIEYLKVLKRSNNKNLNENDINMIMSKNNISAKVLNQEIIAKEFNSSKIFNTFINSGKIKINNEVISAQSSLNNSLLNNFNNSVVNINDKVLSKNFNSPIKNNINNFLTIMNDEKRDKINMIKFLSKPRLMSVFFKKKKFIYLFFLCPNNLSYINAIESYIFKFVDINNKKTIGGFDLIKVNFCSLSNNNPNVFYVTTYDGKIERNYEFETDSKENASYYVKSINYLSQLEKCKIYNNKNIFQ